MWCRVEGLKGAVGVAVGEKHSLAMQAWHQGPLLDVTWAGESADDWPAFSPAGFLDQVCHLYGAGTSSAQLG